MKKTTSVSQQTESKVEQQTAIQTQIKENSTTFTTVSDTLHNKMGSETTHEQTIGEEEVIIIKEYDTNKPLDTITRKPPLKREIIQTKNKVNTKIQRQSIEQTTDQHREITEKADKTKEEQITSQQHVQQQQDTTSTTDWNEKRGLSAMQQLLCAIGSCVILGVLVWLGIKFIKY